MTITTFLGTIAVAFLAMEVAAGLMHRFVMHGILWIWHVDHHVQTGNVFQKNDLFALMFAIPSWLLIMTGMQTGPRDIRTAIGFGVLAYGAVYTVVHETIIHGRLPWRIRTKHWYFDALREAHAVHHRSLIRGGCKNFGMLCVHWRYFRKHQARAKERPLAMTQE